MSTILDNLQSTLSEAADDIAAYARERLDRAAYTLADETVLTVDAAVEFLSDQGEIEAVAEQFPLTVSDHLARTDPETLRQALRDHDELQAFDVDDATRYLSEIEDYAQSVRDLTGERLEDVPGELESIASEIDSLVERLRDTLDL